MNDIFKDYLAGNNRDQLVRRKLVGSLYTQPASLALGALGGIATAVTAAVISRNTTIEIFAGMLIFVAVARVVAAMWLSRDTRADERVLEIAFEVGALSYAFVAGLIGAITLATGERSYLPTLTISYALVYGVGIAARNAGRPVMAVGLALITAGMVWYAQISEHSHFATGLLPGYLLVGVGMAFSFIPMSIAALAGVQPHEAGLASGLINTSQQIGGALGVAIAATVAFTHTTTLLHSGHSVASAQTGGFALGFWVIAGFGAAAIVATLALVRPQEVAFEAETAEAF